MTGRQFYDWQTAGGGGDVLLLVETLERLEIPWCMIGGLAVNHWAKEPMATADVDVVVATDRVEDAVRALEEAGFKAERFEWSINLKGRSKVSVQISTESFYRDYPARAVPADVHGILMRVASLEDALQGKIKAWREPERRASKRQKDFADILRLVESHPELRKMLPEDVAAIMNEIV
ncbi:MAG: nucleotidyl transferase AbiEii/AbiGii toxin family protein [Planctomycetes bacterium]|nr:nucleotidyl transferase AbiEii/AbiGii toxin family protein [Planctomycetota bacterium]MBU4398533.1 nucleotidyl transferase AbiEii/AbiGii toxin family protein [Planctomycetota bacterium]MCG2682127.1 nucleotidyl transferase AbiEii/AbiGii toxin family protein [Planctomycetales bacterium]